MEPEESPIKTVLGSLARNSLASDTISVQNMNNSANYRRKKKRHWKPISIEDVPFRFGLHLTEGFYKTLCCRRQDRMTLNARNRIDRDKKLIFFIVGIGLLFIVVGLFLLLVYKVYSEDEKHVRPVIIIGIKSWKENSILTSTKHSRSMSTGSGIHVSVSVGRSLPETL